MPESHPTLAIFPLYKLEICCTFTPTLAVSKHCMFDRMHPFKQRNKLLIAGSFHKPWNMLYCLQPHWPCFNIRETLNYKTVVFTKLCTMASLLSFIGWFRLHCCNCWVCFYIRCQPFVSILCNVVHRTIKTHTQILTIYTQKLISVSSFIYYFYKF